MGCGEGLRIFRKARLGIACGGSHSSRRAVPIATRSPSGSIWASTPTGKVSARVRPRGSVTATYATGWYSSSSKSAMV